MTRKNIEFAAELEKVWPEIQSLFPLDTGKQIKTIAKNKLLKSQVTQLKSDKAIQIMIARISEAIDIVFVRSGMEIIFDIKIIEKISNIIIDTLSDKAATNK